MSIKSIIEGIEKKEIKEYEKLVPSEEDIDWTITTLIEDIQTECNIPDKKEATGVLKFALDSFEIRSEIFEYIEEYRQDTWKKEKNAK